MGERMRRVVPRKAGLNLLAVGAVLIGLSCGGGDITAPDTGSLEITTATSGPEPDSDGYSVLLGGTERGWIGVSGSLVLDQLAPGVHQVALSGLAPNCQHDGDNPRSVTVTAGGTTTASFTITCSAISPTTGSIEITTVTTGSQPDPDGFVVSVDGGEEQRMEVNATLALSSVPAGPHSIQLSGLATHCTLESSNLQQVTVTAGQRATVSFTAKCLGPYRAIDLGTLGGSESKAYGINSKGHVVGSSQIALSADGTGGGQRHAFLWQGTVMTNLDGPFVPFDESNSIAYGINSRDQVVGSYDVGDGDPLAIIWEGGRFTYLPGLGGQEENATAYAINDAGHVVGDDLSGESEQGSFLHIFLWQAGTNRDLGQGTPYAINNLGQIVGSAGFLWTDGVFTRLGALSGHQESTAYGINDAGIVVGGSNAINAGFERGPTLAFLWEEGRMTPLGTLGGDYSVAYGINATTQVVGTSNKSAGGPERPFLWENGVMTELGTLGGSRGTARAINDGGQIAGWSETTSGEVHATLWKRD